MSLGGGGNSGSISFPSYMETMHSDWLTEVDAVIAGAVVGDNPYTTAYAYNPDTEIQDMETALASWNTEIAAIAPETDWQSYFDTVKTKLDATIFSSTAVDDTVNAYETAQQPAYFRAINRFTGGMSDINAVHNSSFIIGLALIENDFQNSIAGFRAQIEGQNDRIRVGALIQATQDVMRLAQLHYGLLGSYTQVQTQISAATITAKKEQFEADLGIDVNWALWDFIPYERGGAVLASISGAPSMPPGTPKISSAMGGLMGGLAQGAQLGAIGGPEAAIFGSLIFGSLGAFAGWAGGS